jgi:hypothetical protein
VVELFKRNEPQFGPFTTVSQRCICSRRDESPFDEDFDVLGKKQRARGCSC